MLLDSVQYTSYYPGDGLSQYTPVLSPSSSPTYYSPSPSPFSSTENFFSFPPTHTYTEVKDDWRSGYESQPHSPLGFNYQPPFESPLLSQSTLEMTETLRYTNTTPADIPETVRFSSTTLVSGEHGLNLYSDPVAAAVDQSFGHNIQFSQSSNLAQYTNYQTSSNLQV